GVDVRQLRGDGAHVNLAGHDISSESDTELLQKVDFATCALTKRTSESGPAFQAREDFILMGSRRNWDAELSDDFGIDVGLSPARSKLLQGRARYSHDGLHPTRFSPTPRFAEHRTRLIRGRRHRKNAGLT